MPVTRRSASVVEPVTPKLPPIVCPPETSEPTVSVPETFAFPVTFKSAGAVVVPMPTSPEKFAVPADKVPTDREPAEIDVAEIPTPEIFPPLMFAFVIVGFEIFVPESWSMR